MATCSVCIGYKFCSRGRNGQTNFYGKDVACNSVEYLCNDFKNKADFQEVKHGEWIKKDHVAEAEFKCSACRYSYIEADPSVECDFNYCPECGAKMDGKENNNA